MTDMDLSNATDMVAIKHYFFEGVPAKDFSPEYRALTDTDKKELADGIRDGSLDY